jgi:hypothetical protein
MHKLIEYICEELEDLERKAEKDGKLSMAEIQYMDTLAHAKKNLLKGEEMMGEDGYSEMGESSMRGGSNRTDGGYRQSMARGRGRNAKRDSMGRYSSNRGQSMRGGQSYGDDMQEMVESIYEIMDDLPDQVKHDAQKFVKKLEQAM